VAYPPKQHYTTQSVETPLPREVRHEIALLFGLFVSFRLMSIWWFQPGYVEVKGFFLPFAYLQDIGYHPFFDYWLEYPPLLAYLVVGLRWLAVGFCGRGDVAWEATCLVRATQLSSILWETASLAVVYALAKMLRGPKAAVRACWVYVALFSTAFVSLSYLDTFPVFLMLAGLYSVAQSRLAWAALLAAAGFMAKLFPIGFLPVLLKCEARWRWRLLPIGVFVLSVGCIAAPFLISGRKWLAASFDATARRPPWQTVWALLDGRYDFGYVGPTPRDISRENHKSFVERYVGQPAVRSVLLHLPPEVYTDPEPALLPLYYLRDAKTGKRDFAKANEALLDLDGWWKHRVAFYRVASRFATRLSFLDSGPRTGALYWCIYGAAALAALLFYVVTFASLPSALPPRRRVVFAALSMFLLFLLSKGWSPQFALYLIPLLLIVFPLGEGGLWALVLTLLAFLEMPVWAACVLPQAGPTALGSQLLLQGTTIARTALFLVVIVRLYRLLSRD